MREGSHLADNTYLSDIWDEDEMLTMFSWLLQEN